jgi:hypothetical protein
MLPRFCKKRHTTVEDYCQRRWGWKRSRAEQLITAASVANELAASVTTVTEAPMNERQARELARLPEEQRAEVWSRAVEEHGERVVCAMMPRP